MPQLVSASRAAPNTRFSGLYMDSILAALPGDSTVYTSSGLASTPSQNTNRGPTNNRVDQNAAVVAFLRQCVEVAHFAKQGGELLLLGRIRYMPLFQDLQQGFQGLPGGTVQLFECCLFHVACVTWLGFALMKRWPERGDR